MKLPKKPAEEAQVPKRAEIDSFIEPIQRDAEASVVFIEALVVKTDAEREFASNALSEVASRHDAYDKKRKAWVQPLKAVASDIDATFRPALQALKHCEQMLKEKIGMYDVAQAQARAALLVQAAAAGASGNREAAEAAYVVADQFSAASAGAGSKIEWTGEVVDATQIPREYLCPDVKKLEALTKARGEDPCIPGWRAYQVAAVRTSRRGSNEG
jgi:hypothetical protein